MITQKINYAKLAEMQGPNGRIMRDMMRRGLRVQALARQRCPVYHGVLRNSITVGMAPGRLGLKVNIGTNVKYASFVHEGTASPIVPVRATVLRFTARSGDIVFAPEVQGQEGVPFLKDALIAARG